VLHGSETQGQASVRFGFHRIAFGLAREGAEVVVNGRTDPKVSEAVKRIAGRTAATVSGLAADLGSTAGVDRLLSKLGRVDILVNISASSSRNRFSRFLMLTGCASSKPM
jgi:NAD(P)-dependent dehydrogenase (short-subunit alcohol dehydrogenase family)